MTPSNGNIFRVTGLLRGNSPVTGEFPAQRPMTRNFEVFFDLRLNKRLSKQSWGWWFETPSCPLWRYCNVKLRETLWHKNTFRVTCLLNAKSIRQRWIPLQKGAASDAEFCFLCCLPEHAVEPTVEFRMIWNDLTLSWRRCNMSIVPVPRFMLPILCITLRSSRQTSCGKKNYGVWKPKFSLSGTGSRYHSHTV